VEEGLPRRIPVCGIRCPLGLVPPKPKFERNKKLLKKGGFLKPEPGTSCEIIRPQYCKALSTRKNFNRGRVCSPATDGKKEGPGKKEKQAFKKKTHEEHCLTKWKGIKLYLFCKSSEFLNFPYYGGEGESRHKE